MIKVNMRDVIVDGGVVQISAELSAACRSIATELCKSVDRKVVSGLFMRVIANGLIGKSIISGAATDQEVFDMIQTWVAEGPQPTGTAIN